jgi:hypothetical protein
VVAGGGPWCGGSPQALKATAALASDKTMAIAATERMMRAPKSVDALNDNSTVRYRNIHNLEVKQ